MNNMTTLQVSWGKKTKRETCFSELQDKAFHHVQEIEDSILELDCHSEAFKAHLKGTELMAGLSSDQQPSTSTKVVSKSPSYKPVE